MWNPFKKGEPSARAKAPMTPLPSARTPTAVDDQDVFGSSAKPLSPEDSAKKYTLYALELLQPLFSQKITTDPEAAKRIAAATKILAGEASAKDATASGMSFPAGVARQALLILAPLEGSQSFVSEDAARRVMHAIMALERAADGSSFPAR